MKTQATTVRAVPRREAPEPDRPLTRAAAAGVVDTFERVRGRAPKNPIPTQDTRKAKNTELRRVDGPLFDGRPKPKDGTQGDDGDCFWLATIFEAAVYRDPKYIEDMIRPVSDGLYEVTLHMQDKRGRFYEKKIQVTNEFHVDKESGEPVYCKGRMTKDGPVLWPMLLEKAAAIALSEDDPDVSKRGSYSAIDGGYEGQAIAMVTGTHSRKTVFTEGSEDRVWQRLTSAIDERRLVVMGTPGEAGTEHDPKMNKLGLCGGHVYTVISAREDEDGQRFVTLRNPWGSFEPGDTDPDGDEKDATPTDGKEDGQFEAKLEWVVKHFSDMHTSS